MQKRIFSLKKLIVVNGFKHFIMVPMVPWGLVR